MSVYMTEEEQLQAIKTFWSRYGSWITTALIIILVVILGFKYWYWHQSKLSTQASNTYEQLMIAFAHHDDKQATAYANQLIKKFDHTIYADAARLALAKLNVKTNHFEKANRLLKQVTTNSSLISFRQIAAIRSARLYIAQKEYDNAFAELNVVKDEAYLSMVNELKGDIYVAKRQFKLANLAYQNAVKLSKARQIANTYLEMKANEVASLI